jgi:hypothetical protein
VRYREGQNMAHGIKRKWGQEAEEEEEEKM